MFHLRMGGAVLAESYLQLSPELLALVYTMFIVDPRPGHVNPHFSGHGSTGKSRMSPRCWFRRKNAVFGPFTPVLVSQHAVSNIDNKLSFVMIILHYSFTVPWFVDDRRSCCPGVGQWSVKEFPYSCPGKISGVISKTAPRSDSAESATSLPYDGIPGTSYSFLLT
jgi:hypothetical protein